jgi:hypothetical protein
MADRPPPEPPKPTGTGFFYKDGREMPPTHPDHGPMGDIPVEESARVSAYYYCSKEELDAFGIDGPPPRRTRVDGWTESCQRNFVKTLAATGTWSGAAAVVGRSRQSAAKLYNRSPAFRAACDEALRAVKFVLHATALERAVEGVREPVFYKGERVGERTRYNDRLLMFLLKARDPLNFAPLSELEGWLRHRPPTPDGGLDDALDRLEASEKAWEQRLPGEEIRPRTIAHPEPAGLPGSGAGAEQAIGLSEPSEAEVGPPPVSLSGGGPVLEPPGPHT